MTIPLFQSAVACDRFNMHNLSDSDSVDSDEGIRYKTESIRNKTKKNEESGTDRNKSSHRSLSSHSHYKSRQNNRSRRYSPSDSDSSRQKRNSTRKRKDPSPSRDSSENRHKSEKRKKEDTSRYKQRNSDIGKKEKFEKRDISRHDSSSKTDKKSKLTVIDCEPELPKNLQKTDEQKISKPENSKQKIVDEQKISKPENSKQKIVYLGPALPPSFKKMIEIKTDEDESKINEINSGINNENKEESVSSAENNHAIGPTLPQQIMIKKQITSEETKKVLGPALPPHLKTTEKAAQSHATSPLPNELGATDRCIGPSLPFHLRKKLAEADTTDNEEINEIETYGPVPVGSSFSQAHLDLEERALQMKINQLGPNEKKDPVREEWMVQLPDAKASNLGLGPRQFRAKAGPDLSDRSSWTDTPQDKDKKKQGKEEPKVDLQREAELREIRKRDKEQEVVVKKSKRDKESLVNIHMKKMKDKKDSSASTERRPFSRELDLQVNRFDEAQKKAVLKKAQLLDTRFSSGESKFL
ncbi:unnamed protein product [Phaedon cochleariae]|uniref:DUF3752 domain-containing protein n=1 Tax=Phaedon cochleariae TaxID=80249 RepID=A0A9P0DMP4_PHACE|nr:unnamed protein product [Phaedon cochleariae]